jgi:LemA protein
MRGPPSAPRRTARMTADMWVWIVVGVVGILVLAAVLIFNRLVRLRNRVDNGWAQIDVQLRRRYDLIPNLVETVRGYAAHERELFEEVTRARTAAIGASSVPDQAEAENQVTHGLRQLLAVVEAYPELRANENFLALQEELTGTESKIAYARQFYNDQVMRLNTLIQSFPSVLVARAFGFGEREFFDIEDPARDPAEVDFTG